MTKLLKTTAGVTAACVLLMNAPVSVYAKEVNSQEKISAEIISDSVTELPETPDSDTEDTSDSSELAVVCVGNFATVRADADMDSDAVGKLYDGNIVEIKEENGDWYHIESGNVDGYVISEFVIAGDEQAVEDAKVTYAVAESETSVRHSAEEDAEVKEEVAEETKMEVVAEGDDWVEVKYDSTSDDTGYVDACDVVLSKEYTYGETLEEEEERIRQETDYGAELVEYAKQFLGNPYRYGGSSLTNGTDCSGFVMSLYAHYGISLPHSSRSLRSVGTAVSTSEMQPGDIVCYSGHVAIYAGDGQIIHASTYRTGIIMGNVYYKNIICVRRIF